MLNGKDDWIFPLETSQQPLFERLGTPKKDKRHALFDGGHVIAPDLVARELHAWLDNYLGPVKRTAK
jgi:hypothetical protein